MLSCNLYSAVPIDFVDISSFCKWDCVIVYMPQDIRNSSSGFKNANMTFFTRCGPAPSDKKCHSEHQTFLLLFRRVWERDNFSPCWSQSKTDVWSGNETTLVLAGPIPRLMYGLGMRPNKVNSILNLTGSVCSVLPQWAWHWCRQVT